MSSSIDDFPDLELPGNRGKVKTFSLGSEEPEVEDLDDVYSPPEPEPEAAPGEPLPADVVSKLQDRAQGGEPALRAGPKTPALPSIGPDVTAAMMVAAERALETPAVAALAKIANDRFYKERPPADENSRVTRNWLLGLGQREFFLAIGFPGHALYRRLDGMHPLTEIRNWVDGLAPLPPVLRKVLMLEHLLDRRTLSNRINMPRREQIEAAMARLPRTAAVSAVLGGFEAVDRLQPMATMAAGQPAGSQATPEEIGEMLRIVRPGEVAPPSGGRPGSKLPMSKRALGKGRPLGGKLEKPDSYCYTLSKRSVDKLTGQPRIRPIEVMQAINRAADLEARYRVYYSLRRKNMDLPWSPDNIELLPTEELERQRQRGDGA